MGGLAMSVINQMLNQLEQRGAQAASGQSMVRAVPARRSFSRLVWVIALAVFAAAMGIGAGYWTKAHSTGVHVATGGMQQLSDKKNSGASSDAGGPVQLNQPIQLADPAPDAAVAKPPASHLSFELSPVPVSGATVSFGKVLEDIPEASKPARQKTVRESRLRRAKSTHASTKAVVQPVEEVMPMKRVSTTQLADAEFRKAAALMQQGRIADALAGYQDALRLDPGHDAARQALVVLLMEQKRAPEAEQILQDRLNSKPDQTGFIMMLARLQVERGAVAEATATLEKGLPHAIAQADYQAFLAALLQRQNRNDEAIAHYQIALQLAPNNGIWQMGYGISLQAKQRNADAKAAYKRALDTQTLTPDLRAFVQQKLKEL